MPPPLEAHPANGTPGTKPGRPCKKPLMCPKSLASLAQVVFSQIGLWAQLNTDWRGTTHLWTKGQNFSYIHSDSHIPVEGQKHGSSTQHEQVRSQTFGDPHGKHEKDLNLFFETIFWEYFPLMICFDSFLSD